MILDINHIIKNIARFLSSIITAAKKKYYDEQILNSNNETKTTWNIVKTVTNNSRNPNKIVSMNIDNHPSSNPVTIAYLQHLLHFCCK